MRVFAGWLEPLMDRVAADGTVIIAPVINIIFKDTFAVEFAPLNFLGGVNLMNIEFKWLPINEARRKNHLEHEPYKYVK